MRELVDVLRPMSPVASVYIGPGAADDWNARWHRLADQLRSDGAGEAVISEVARAVPREPSVLFTGDALSPRVFRTPGLTHPDLAWFTTPAHVLPLLAWQQDRPPCVVVAVDEEGADLHMVPGGGFAQLRYWHENLVPHNARTVARACEAALDRIGARLLVISGDSRAASALRESLSPQITVRCVAGSAGQVAAVTRATARRWTAEVLSDFTTRCRPRGLGVEGVPATLDALALGLVQELLVEYPEDVTATAWFGALPADVLPSDRVPPCSWQRRSGLLADVAVRAALLGGAQVRVVSPCTLTGGIGGRCRSPLSLVRP